MQPMFEYVNLCRNNKGHMLSMSTILVAEKFWYSSFLNIPFYMPIFVLSGQELHLKIELDAPSKNHKENTDCTRKTESNTKMKIEQNQGYLSVNVVLFTEKSIIFWICLFLLLSFWIFLLIFAADTWPGRQNHGGNQ